MKTVNMEGYFVGAQKESELVCEMEEYGLDTVDLTSAHSMGSGTKILDQGRSISPLGCTVGQQWSGKLSS